MNSSFKSKIDCPSIDGEIDRCKFWYNATDATPDFYHDCAGPGAIVGVPGNVSGYQESASNSYVGIFTYVEGATQAIREYIGTTFPALTVGATYTVTMSVSLPEKVAYGTQGLGVYFYVNGNMTPVASQSILPVTPQIDYTSYGVITERNNWVQLTKTFVADSAYTHMVIGNFKADADVQPTEVPSSTDIVYVASYYYIDSVSVSKTPTSINGPDIAGATTFTPNPFHTTAKLAFENPAKKEFTITICDISGRTVRRYEGVTTNYVTIEREDMPKGMYFYKITSEDANYFGKAKVE